MVTSDKTDVGSRVVSTAVIIRDNSAFYMPGSSLPLIVCEDVVDGVSERHDRSSRYEERARRW